MNHRQFLDNMDFWKQAYCSSRSSELSAEDRAKFADDAVKMYCQRLDTALGGKMEISRND